MHDFVETYAFVIGLVQLLSMVKLVEFFLPYISV